jgi:hypothetical protein
VRLTAIICAEFVAPATVMVIAAEYVPEGSPDAAKFTVKVSCSPTGVAYTHGPQGKSKSSGSLTQNHDFYRLKKNHKVEQNG